MTTIRKRPVGTAQLSLLHQMADAEDGRWYAGCGWGYESLPWTVILMTSLVHHGLVDEIVPSSVYKINVDGLRTIIKLGYHKD